MNKQVAPRTLYFALLGPFLTWLVFLVFCLSQTRHHGTEQRLHPLPAGVTMPSFLSQALASEVVHVRLGQKRTSFGPIVMSAFDPKQTLGHTEFPISGLSYCAVMLATMFGRAILYQKKKPRTSRGFSQIPRN